MGYKRRPLMEEQNRTVEAVVRKFPGNKFLLKCSCGQGNRRFDQELALKFIGWHNRCARLSVKVEVEK